MHMTDSGYNENSLIFRVSAM